MRRLGDVARGTETVLRGLEVILEIWRLGGNFFNIFISLSIRVLESL